MAYSFTSEAKQNINIYTGSKTGTYFQFGNDIKSIDDDQNQFGVTVVESSGSIDNIKRIVDDGKKGNIAFGIVQSDVLGFLSRSENELTQELAKNLRLVFPFYQEEVHILASTKIKKFSDLNDKTVAVGPVGSGSWLTAKNMFNLTDTKPLKTLRISPEEGVLAVLSGRAEAMIFVGGKPVKLFKNLEALENLKDYKKMLAKTHLLNIKDRRILDEYIESKIQEDTYSFLDKEVSTVAVLSMMVSYDDTKRNSGEKCSIVKDFSDEVSKSVGILKDDGHIKWNEVELAAEVGNWKKDSCSSEESGVANIEKDLFEELEN